MLWALLTGSVLTAWNPGAEALAGCAASPPELVSGPRQMPPNGALSLLLTHPMWHSRGAATGPTSDGAPLGSKAEDLPFVLSRGGATEPLKIRATRKRPRGQQVIVEITPAAGWVPGASYVLRADVGTKAEYPPFSAVDTTDTQAPTWAAGKPSAVVVRPEPPEPIKEHCETTGRGKLRTTTCTISTGSYCPPPVQEAHVALRLPQVQDDRGGVITLEVSAGAITTWVPAGRELNLGLEDACDPPNFPAPNEQPYELLVTPIDAANNRGATLRIPVDPRKKRKS